MGSLLVLRFVVPGGSRFEGGIMLTVLAVQRGTLKAFETLSARIKQALRATRESNATAGFKHLLIVIGHLFPA